MTITWTIGSNGTGKRHWFVVQPGRVLSDPRGNYRRFASPEAAQRAADKANAQ